MKPSETKAADQDAVLTISHIIKTYPGVIALNGVSLELKRGEVHAIVGENGAGKSTLIKVISGSTSPDSGRFTIDGRQFEHITPRLAKEMGMEVIYQELNLVPDVSVAENVFLGDYRGNGVLINAKAMEQKAGEVFKELGISIDPRVKAGSLSVAQMQFVEIAKAIVREVKILVMDEPTAPLTSKDVEILFALIRRLKKQGVTIVYISHRLNEIYELSDRVTVLRDGELIATADTKDLDQDELIRLMVGRQLSETYPPRETKLGDTILKVEGLSGNGVRDISFELRQGEILGFAGLIGSGRTETMRLLFGADKKLSGNIEFDGKQVDINSPQKAVQLGIGFVPEDRKLHGVLLGLSIRENISLPILKRLSTFLLLHKKKEDDVIENYKDALKIKTPSVEQLVRNLSGGNQQKVVVSKWLASSSKVLVFDEPTRGIDVGAKYEIYQMMNTLSRQGIGIIMVSSEMEELIGMADRILVLYEGECTGELVEKSEFTQERIMGLASKVGKEGA